MSDIYRKIIVVLALQFTSMSVLAEEFSVSIEIPRLDVAEYHRPYIAVWVATENNRVAANLSVLYDVSMRDDEGEKWLKDLRQWWRRAGRSLDIPIDGVTGATRAQGLHSFDFTDKLHELPAGQYRLMVEVVREVGGRELQEIPFEWPAKEHQQLKANGETEIGTITLQLNP